MSAFMVSDATINRTIATLATSRDLSWIRREIKSALGCDLETEQGQRGLGEAMFRLNVSGVNARYGENSAQDFRDLDYQFQPEFPPTHMQALVHLGCWLYQCTEGDLPDESLLYSTMERGQGQLALHIVSQSPQYSQCRRDAA